jgi:hypothetical protein
MRPLDLKSGHVDFSSRTCRLEYQIEFVEVSIAHAHAIDSASKLANFEICLGCSLIFNEISSDPREQVLFMLENACSHFNNQLDNNEQISLLNSTILRYQRLCYLRLWI